MRRRPAFGWIVQQVRRLVVENGIIANPQQPATTQPGTIALTGDAAVVSWGRPLFQGRGALQPFGNDLHPTLDADPLL